MKRKYHLPFFMALLFIGCYHQSLAQLYINEFMASNSGGIVDPDYNESADWIEIYNAGTSSVQLNGYFITDNLGDKTKWQIKSNATIEASNYLIIWADGMDAGLHTNFKLSATGEELALVSPSQVVIDSIVFGNQDPNISMGRKTDGSSEWVYFTESTPRASNNTINYSGIVKSDPSFSIPGGIYHAPITLEIKSIFGGDVRYTLDGTEPNEQSKVALAPISISKNTVVRARICKTGQILGPVNTNTYLIDTENKINNLPIVCLSSDPVNFWDPVKGIYVVHDEKPKWEIPVNIELYENDGRIGAAFNLRAGIKSTGLYSWQLPEKMLGVSFRKEYGASKLEYPLIFDKQRKVYDTFSLRASGSDWGKTMMRDAMIQSAAVENTNIDDSGYRDCVVFINGEYMGIHNIREKVDEDYIVGNRGLESGSFDLVEETDAGHYAEAGDLVANADFVSLYKKDLANQSNYDAVAEVMDIEDFTDMVCSEVYSGNSSIGHNLMKYKTKGSGKWKWILMDFDRGFEGINSNLIDFYVNNVSSDDWPFRNLMANESYKKQFGIKLADLLFTTFNSDRIISRIENHKKTLEAEMPNHINRWAGTHGTGNYSSINAISSMSYWNSEVEVLKTFAQDRPSVILKDLTNYGFQSPVAVSVTTSPAKAGNLTFNGLKILVDVCNGGYPKGEEIKLTASAKAGFTFKGWKTNSDSLFIGRESTWKYSDTGVDLGTSWKNSGFSDATWKSGQAELGYGDGDGDEKTSISYGSSSSNKFITSYFRKSFNLTNKENISWLTMLLKCDDGAVIYLNGNEIQRYNMPSGNIGFSTTAPNSVAGTEESDFLTYSIGTEYLVNGNNVIAVEVHQNSASSSDVSFDLELSATMTGTGNYLSTAKELGIIPQSAVHITAVFEGDGKCILPSEISSVMTLQKTCSPYVVPANVLITSSGKLIIEPGVEIWMSDGVSINSEGQINAKGTKAEPVIFRSNPQSVEKKWGNISVRNASDTSFFRNVIIEDASKGLNPSYDIFALNVFQSNIVMDSLFIDHIFYNPVALYNSNTLLSNSSFHTEYDGADLINIKFGKILIEHCEFVGNDKLDCDAIDFGDMETGNAIVKNSYFYDMEGFNSDAIDLGDRSKDVSIDSIIAFNIQDKGVSVGQRSSAKISNSVFLNCGMGIGMKDSSRVNIDHCSFYGSDYAIANYQKHPGDAGANAVVTNSVLSNSYESGYLNDEYSAISISNSLDDTEKLPDGKNNLHANPLFTNPNFYDFSLMSGSPLIGAGTAGTTIGTKLELPEITPSLMFSDIAYFTTQGTDELEFIGLYNPGNSRILLDSCMFTKGITFQFSNVASIGPKEKIFITSNVSSSFWNGRGTILYQWTSGRLADEGETIQMVNKYGKVIDQVKYNNKSPWPVPAAASQGISLKRYDADNHFGENWQLLPTNEMVSIKSLTDKGGLKIYPNPTNGLITIDGDRLPTSTIEVYNLSGLKVHEENANSIHQKLNLGNLQQGVYIIKVGADTQRFIIMR
jgi:hypothetical protein